MSKGETACDRNRAPRRCAGLGSSCCPLLRAERGLQADVHRPDAPESRRHVCRRHLGTACDEAGEGKKIDPSSSDVTKYADYLKGTHDQALSHVGGGQKLYDYVYSLNGFAAKLTEDQATRLRARRTCWPSRGRDPDHQTSTTPHFLGLDVKGGSGTTWRCLQGRLNKGAGEDEVIGVIDSGVWPESQSFSDRKLDGSSGNNYPHKVTGFSGACQTGEQWTASSCNDKPISARYLNAAQGGNEGINEDLPWEFTSPRDTTATVRTRRRPPAATSAMSRPVTPPLQASRRSAAWRRVPASRRTRRCGRRRTARRQVGRSPTSSRPSTRPSRTGST